MTRDNPEERTRRLWDRYAPRYDRQIRVSERLLFPGGRSWACSQAVGEVLEVAVGTGLNLPCYPDGTVLAGIDLSPAMLAIARGRARALGLEAELREGNAEALPFADASFDTVVCTVSLCNIPDDRAAIAEMYRVLRPGGRLILLDHVASDRRWVLAAEKLLEPLSLRRNGDYLTRRPLPLVTAAGFTIEHSQRLKAGIIERLTAVKPATHGTTGGPGCLVSQEAPVTNLPSTHPATRPLPATRGLSPRARAGLILLLKPWASWAAHAAITGRTRSRADPAAGRFTRAEVTALLRQAWDRLGQLTPRLPAEPTPGSRQNVLLAALTLALFQALLDDGIERRYAIELTGDACWKIYAQWGQIPRLIARLRTRDPARRLRIAVDLFLRFPFNQPGYIRQDQPEPHGRALDILRCPVAGYLAAHGGADLAVGSWCNLDFPLARMWGGTLQRRGTLASGARQCDFRFLAARHGEDQPHARLRKRPGLRDASEEGGERDTGDCFLGEHL